MSYTATKAELKTICDTLEGDELPLNIVYDYFEVKPEQFPCAMIRTFVPAPKERVDSAYDMLEMHFVIRVLIREKNDSETEALVNSLLDSFVAKFNEPAIVDTLNGVVQKLDTEFAPLEIPDMDKPLVGFDILVSASKLQSIT